MWLHMWLHMRLLGQLTIVSPLIVTSLVLHLAYRNLDFSSRLAAYKKSIQRRAGLGIGLEFPIQRLIWRRLWLGLTLSLGFLPLWTGPSNPNHWLPAD